MKFNRNILINVFSYLLIGIVILGSLAIIDSIDNRFIYLAIENQALKDYIENNLTVVNYPTFYENNTYQIDNSSLNSIEFTVIDPNSFTNYSFVFNSSPLISYNFDDWVLIDFNNDSYPIVSPYFITPYRIDLPFNEPYTTELFFIRAEFQLNFDLQDGLNLDLTNSSHRINFFYTEDITTVGWWMFFSMLAINKSISENISLQEIASPVLSFGKNGLEFVFFKEFIKKIEVN